MMLSSVNNTIRNNKQVGILLQDNSQTTIENNIIIISRNNQGIILSVSSYRTIRNLNWIRKVIQVWLFSVRVKDEKNERTDAHISITDNLGNEIWSGYAKGTERDVKAYDVLNNGTTKTITVVMDKNITVVLERIDDKDEFSRYVIPSVIAIVLIAVVISIFIRKRV